MTTKLNVYLPDGAGPSDPATAATLGTVKLAGAAPTDPANPAVYTKEAIDAMAIGGGSSAPVGYTRREAFSVKRAGSTSVENYGMAPTVVGTVTNIDDQDGAWLRYTTAASVGAVAGLYGSASNAAVRRAWLPEGVFVLKTPPSLANVGLWAGFADANLTNAGADQTGNAVAAFRYYPSVDGTAFWRTVTGDDSAAPGTILVTTTAAVIAPDTRYALRIAMEAAAVKFYVNDTLVATHAASLPSPNFTVFAQLNVMALAAAAASFRYNRIWLSSL